MIKSALLLFSAVAMSVSVMPSIKTAAQTQTAIEQFRIAPSTTVPSYEVMEVKYLPTLKESLTLADSGTYIAPPKTIVIPSQPATSPYRGSNGQFSSNPFGSAPRRLY